MGSVLKSRIIKIGNSRGVRIPKVWLEQLALGEEVELVVESRQIVIRQAHSPRAGWNESFRDMSAQHDDQLLDRPLPTRWDREEWTW